MTKVPRPKPSETQKQVSVQVPESVAIRLNGARARMSAAAGGVAISQSDVLRVVIERGLEVLEGIQTPATTERTKKPRR